MNDFDKLVLSVLNLLKNKLVNKDFSTCSLEYYYLKITEEEWSSLFSFLLTEGLISSISSFNIINKTEFLESLNITLKGIEYIHKNDIVKFPSAKLLLSVVKTEYQKEISRTNTIDVKISTLIALLAFLFPVYIGLLEANIKWEYRYSIIYMIFVLLTLLLSIISLMLLLKAITTRAYYSVAPDEIIND